MEVNQALERGVVIERAEVVRNWLSGLGLSSRALGALDRELLHVMTHDTSDGTNGHTPLAGLTIEQFVAELHSPNAGAVGRVARVGQGIIAELRALIPADGLSAAAQPPEEVTPHDAPAHDTSAEAVADSTSAEPVQRRRGRPKGSKNKPRVFTSPGATLAPAPRSSPRLTPPSDLHELALLAAEAQADTALGQLLKLWPKLHPHARRAMVLYASTLLAEK